MVYIVVNGKVVAVPKDEIARGEVFYATEEEAEATIQGDPDPQEGDTFVGNPTDNDKYSRFCETLGLIPKEETRTIDGKETTVKLLPALTPEQMLGRPVTAHLKKVKDEWTNNKGEKMHYSWRVSFFKSWDTGVYKEMKVNEDDLPF